MQPKTTSVGPWDIKLITSLQLVETPHSFEVGALWWKKRYNTIQKEYKRVTEAFILVRHDKDLYAVGMCDKGFGYHIDNRQLSGDLTAGNIVSVEVINPYKKGDWQRFKDVVGRKEWDRVKLDGFKAVAYILGIDNWEEATIDTFRK
jgi:hypothetical protein